MNALASKSTSQSKGLRPRGPHVEASGLEDAEEILPGYRFLSSAQVMRLLGYSDRASFWQFCRTEGCPHTRISRRRILFNADELRAWLASRSTGAGESWRT